MDTRKKIEKVQNVNISGTASQHYDREHVNETARRLRIFIRFCALIVGTWFIYDTVKDLFRSIPLHSLATSDSAKNIIKVGLALYFFSWLFGAQDDTKIQARGYLVYKKKKLNFLDYAIMSSIAVSFALMCWFHSNYHTLLGVFLIFVLTNIAGYKYLVVETSKHSISPSRAHLEKDDDLILKTKLDVVEEYMLGSWQMWRFAYALVGVIVLNALFNFGAFSSLGLNGPFPEDTIAATGFLMLIITIEGWMWVKRRTAISNIQILFELQPLREKYCKKCRNEMVSELKKRLISEPEGSGSDIYD